MSRNKKKEQEEEAMLKVKILKMYNLNKWN